MTDVFHIKLLQNRVKKLQRGVRSKLFACHVLLGRVEIVVWSLYDLGVP